MARGMIGYVRGREEEKRGSIDFSAG